MLKKNSQKTWLLSHGHLMLFSTIFQLYHGRLFYWWMVLLNNCENGLVWLNVSYNMLHVKEV
jgi:hypothetical protein